MTAQRLQLTWYNKDKALIPTETGKYGYTWVDPSDPRYCETHTLVLDDYVQGSQTPKSDKFAYSERADLEPQDDNLLILGESGDVLEALTRVPELAEKYVGKVKLIYIETKTSDLIRGEIAVAANVVLNRGFAGSSAVAPLLVVESCGPSGAVTASLAAPDATGGRLIRRLRWRVCGEGVIFVVPLEVACLVPLG